MLNFLLTKPNVFYQLSCHNFQEDKKKKRKKNDEIGSPFYDGQKEKQNGRR